MRPKRELSSEVQQPSGVPARKVRSGDNTPNFGSRAHSIFQISVLLGVCVLAAVETSFARPCNLGGTPQTTYRFVGQCTDCTGTGVGLLTVQGYTLGNALNECNFVSFTYSSNLTSFTITQSGLFSLSGTLPVSLPSAATVSLSDFTNGFSSNVNGNWRVGLLDVGTGGVWGLATPTPTAAPTLSTAALGALGLLLAGAGALLARSRRTARA